MLRARSPLTMLLSSMMKAKRFFLTFSHLPTGQDGLLLSVLPAAVKRLSATLIPRFYEISSGSISVDGDIRTVTRSSLRQKIGIVQQDVFLFTGTIFDNIAYGKLGASREEVIEAAKKQNIHDYIMSLPEGYETFVGERGVKLRAVRNSVSRLRVSS